MSGAVVAIFCCARCLNRSEPFDFVRATLLVVPTRPPSLRFLPLNTFTPDIWVGSCKDEPCMVVERLNRNSRLSTTRQKGLLWTTIVGAQKLCIKQTLLPSSSIKLMRSLFLITSPHHVSFPFPKPLPGHHRCSHLRNPEASER